MSAWVSAVGWCMVSACAQSQQSSRSLNSARFQRWQDKLPFQPNAALCQPGSETALLVFWGLTDSREQFARLLTLIWKEPRVEILPTGSSPHPLSTGAYPQSRAQKGRLHAISTLSCPSCWSLPFFPYVDCPNPRVYQ